MSSRGSRRAAAEAKDSTKLTPKLSSRPQVREPPSLEEQDELDAAGFVKDLQSDLSNKQSLALFQKLKQSSDGLFNDFTDELMREVAKVFSVLVLEPEEVYIYIYMYI